MNQLKKKFIASILICCASFSNSSQSSPNSCSSDVQAFVKKIPTSHNSFVSNPASPAVWSQSHYLRGLVEIHRGYDSFESLDKLEVGINYILSKTSEKLGFDDVLRGEAQPAWGSINYSCGNYTVSAVHTGVLSYPIAYFAQTVLSNPARYSAYTETALSFLDEAERAISVHTSQFKQSQGLWVYTLPENISDLGICYKENGDINRDFRESDGRILPYNMMLAMGLTHLELSRAFVLPSPARDVSKAAYHRNIAIKLAETFKKALNHVASSNSYQWEYLLGGRQEDIGHAALDIQFVMQMFRESLVFDNEDIQRLINTFNLVSQNKNHIFSHVNKTSTDRGARDIRWQKGIVGWSELSLVDPSVAERARDIFYRFDGGYKPTGSHTWYGEALVLKWMNRNFRFPINAESLGSLTSYRPDYALRSSNVASLFRTPSMQGQTIAGKSVTSCAKYEFHNDQVDDLSIRYAHTTQTGSVDSCAGAGCGTPAGLHVFFANPTSGGWKYGASMSHIAANAYHTKSASSPLISYDQALVCRSGSGHARDNIGIRYLGIDTSSCASNYETDEASFSSMDGWNVGDQTDEAANLPKYKYKHSAAFSGRSNGFIEVSEPTDLSQRVSASNDPTLGNLDLGFHKQFANHDQGFKVNGWTRVTSRYSGISKVNNRCVMALNADTGKTLKSYCMHWENVNDTGWRYFDFDFTPYVTGVNNVRVVIGSWDSWSTNWRQHLRVDDVKVTIRSAGS